MPSGIYKRTKEYRRNLNEARKEYLKNPENHPRYKDGRTLKKHYCIDCGKEIIYVSKRCQSCAAIEISNRPEVKEKRSIKMKQAWQDGKFNNRNFKGKNNPNYIDGRRNKKHYCIDCGKEISYTAKRCKNCARKRLWQDGMYDNRKICIESPSWPEKRVMEMIENIKFNYTFQFRPKGYSKIYDFYIPKWNLLIEYDSEYWHSLSGNITRDKEKTQYAIDNGYNLLRLNEYNINVLKLILENW